MYENKPKYNITDYLNTNKATPVVTSAPVVKTAPTIAKKVVTPVVKTYSASVTPVRAVIGATPVHIKKPRVLTEKQTAAMAKLKEMGAKMISSNKKFNTSIKTRDKLFNK